MKSILCVVPARGGSKRFPDKNIALLAGDSLLSHTASAIQASGIDMPVILSTDSAKIADVGERLGWQVPFTRPDVISSDDASSVDVALHAVDWWSETHSEKPEWLLLLQPTSPLRGGACIRDAVALVRQRPDANAVVGCCELHVPASAIFETSGKGFFKAIAAGNDSRVYVPNGAIYFVRSKLLRKERSFFPSDTLPLLMPKIQSIDIDTREDLMIAQALHQQGLGNP